MKCIYLGGETTCSDKILAEVERGRGRRRWVCGEDGFVVSRSLSLTYFLLYTYLFLKFSNQPRLALKDSLDAPSAGVCCTKSEKMARAFSHMIASVTMSLVSCFSISHVSRRFSIFSWTVVRSLEIIFTPLAGVIDLMESCLRIVQSWTTSDDAFPKLFRMPLHSSCM